MQPPSPFISRFLAEIGDGVAFAQVWIRPVGTGFELRHVEDREVSLDLLPVITALEARSRMQFTLAKVFRPIRTSPDLPTGWRLQAANAEELEFALNQIYPGALADHYAAQLSPNSVTHYRDFTRRQTGMYRSTAMLSDAQVASVTQACCSARFCLKQRLWTVEGLAPDGAQEKSLIPCLEPCPVLLEFARKAGRMDQEEARPIQVRPEELASLRSALEFAILHPPSTDRQADVANPRNPRRLQRLLDQLPTLPSPDSKE